MKRMSSAISGVRVSSARRRSPASAAAAPATPSCSAAAQHELQHIRRSSAARQPRRPPQAFQAEHDLAHPLRRRHLEPGQRLRPITPSATRPWRAWKAHPATSSPSWRLAGRTVAGRSPRATRRRARSPTPAQARPGSSLRPGKGGGGVSHNPPRRGSSASSRYCPRPAAGRGNPPGPGVATLTAAARSPSASAARSTSRRHEAVVALHALTGLPLAHVGPAGMQVGQITLHRPAQGAIQSLPAVGIRAPASAAASRRSSPSAP